MDRGMERYPLLCLDSTDSYTGYVTLFGEDELIRISRPSDGSWADAVLAVSPTLAAAISEPEALRTCIKRSKCTVVSPNQAPSLFILRRSIQPPISLECSVNTSRTPHLTLDCSL
eukprot:m.43362 g.43362  ORF g.43362 m.43362 type:complete len:115 (-) comp8424_c0_seq1:1124-1468(-)